MNALATQNAYKPKVKYFEWPDALNHVYQTMSETTTICAYVNIDIVSGLEKSYIMKTTEIMNNKEIEAREIIANSDHGKTHKRKHNSKHHQIRLSDNEMLFSADNIILDDRVLHVSFGAAIIVIEIINPVRVNSQKMIFDMAWDGVK